MAKTEAEQVVAEAPSEESLKAQLQDALQSGDFKAVSKVAAEIAKFTKVKESAELEARQQKLADKTVLVRSTIKDALKPLVDAGELDEADGIWYSNDFGEGTEICRLMRSGGKATGIRTGGGGGKKFDISTEDMLKAHGDKQYKDKGMTVQQAWESNTDKNWRYQIREFLLKEQGLI